MFELIDNNRLLTRSLATEFRTQLHNDAGLLGGVFVTVIQSKTPVWTGALRDDETFEVNTDVNGDWLVHVYTDTAEQLAAWNRVYVEYVEGPSLGKWTWTNDPRHMFADTIDYDSKDILESWAEVSVGTFVLSI